MAEPTDKPPESSDDVIDLEGLVRNIDLTPTDSLIAKKEGVASASPAETLPLHAEALSPERIDELLNIEDPEMAKQIEALRGEGFDQADAAALAADEDEDIAQLLPPGKITRFERARFLMLRVEGHVRNLRSFLVRLVKDSKGVTLELLAKSKLLLMAALGALIARMRAKTAWLSSRRNSQKAALLMSFLALGLLVFVTAKTIQGTLLPNAQRAWVADFADHADGKFTYSSTASFEDFNDPLLHPEFVILVERIVVNLSRTQDASESANPMAAFELYLQTDNQEAAVEIKDRSVEIRDAVARSVERMTYPDLAGEDGKAKLKLLIRKDLNEVMTRGKVRRVFFKTIVLNPE